VNHERLDRSTRVRRRYLEQVLARARRRQDALRQLRQDRLQRPDPGQGLGDPASAKAEYDKLIREKRKKGYTDAGEGGSAEPEPEPDGDGDDDDDDDDGDDEPAPAPAKKPAAKPVAAAAPAASSAPGHRMALDAGNRKVDTTIYLDGTTVRMDSREIYATPEAARKAFERLKKMLGGEGYKDA